MNLLIISISSDIGLALAKFWSEKGFTVCGTYRTLSTPLKELQKKYSLKLFPCDLMSQTSMNASIENICKENFIWDNLIMAPGSIEPIGNFADIDFDTWENGFQVNCLQQLRLLHGLLPLRNQNKTPTVLFFAGGGTNNAVEHYSSYTLSKIALIKMCELLDAEIPDTRFVIVGPGLVKTKIHEAMYLAGKERAPKNFEQTASRLQNGDLVPMQKVVQCCDYLVSTPCKAISGRNFSTASDAWGTKELEKLLEDDQHLYKLRRFGNTLRT